MKKTECTIQKYNDAVTARYFNKKITLHKRKKSFNELTFIRIAEKGEDLETPTCFYEVYRGKVLVTKLGLSNEALEALYVVIGRYLKDISEITE